MPSLSSLIDALPDKRNQTQTTYTRYDLVMAAIFLFVLKMGSRNQMNLTSNDDDLLSNVEKLFGFKIAHMDTVNGFLKDLEPEHLEKMLAELVRVLIQRKVIRTSDVLKGYHSVAIDGTGDGAATENDEGTLKKVSKNGKETFYRSLLVASLITPNGFSIPIAVEWIATEDGASKQDCEINAFKRLAAKIKELFPRLRICLIGDALYATATVFAICEAFEWRYIVTVKEKLSTINRKAEKGGGYSQYDAEIDSKVVFREVLFKKNLDYQEYNINWIRTFEENKKKEELVFTYVTNINFIPKQLPELISVARSRWNIEDTFNTIKNRDVAGLHKFSQGCFNAYRNWRIIMFIAQLIEQLVVMAKDMSKIFDRANDTFKNLWSSLVSYLSCKDVDPFEEKPRRKISYPK